MYMSDEKAASEPFETKGFELDITVRQDLPVGEDNVSSEGAESSEGNIKKESKPLPEKRGNKLTRYIRHNFFSTYRKLFAFIFTANMAVLLALCMKTSGTPKLSDVGSATSANLMVAILFRQENFVNLCYEICTMKPLMRLPLFVRRRLAKVFHYGGCHSGCATAAVFWYLLYTALATRDYIHSNTGYRLANMITSWILILMFTIILAGAHPKFRVKKHDAFEAMHRFAGWVAISTFWVHSIFAAKTVASDDGLGKTLIQQPNFWFIIVSTSCSVISWGRLRHRSVSAEVLSDHATRLHFKYTNMPPFYGVKISNKPLTEWHAFATIPEDDDCKGFSVVVSNAGDWTSSIIRNPPSKLWVRGYPLHGLLYTSRLFHKIVVVATGSGIGPCLSLLVADVTPRRILWSTPHPETTYGEKVMSAVLKADPEAVVWNTRTQGRPDMVEMTLGLVEESGAEAVFIISNPKVTRKVVYGMQTRGVPAYGAIFDS